MRSRAPRRDECACPRLSIAVSASALEPISKVFNVCRRSAAQYEQKRESTGIIRAQLEHLISVATLRTVGADAACGVGRADAAERAALEPPRPPTGVAGVAPDAGGMEPACAEASTPPAD